MKEHKPTYFVSLDVPRILLKYVSMKGMDISRLFQHIRMDRDILKKPEGYMPMEQFIVLYEEAVRQSNDFDFGLHFGETVPNFSSGNIVFAMMFSCSTLKGAIEVFCRYHALLGNIAVPKWEDENHQVVFTNEYKSTIGRYYAESVFAMLSITLDRMTENKVRPVDVYFVHNQPGDISEHKRLFGKSPLFKQSYNSLVIDPRVLNEPILLANPIQLSTLEQFAHGLLEGNGLPDSWSQRSSTIIGDLLFHRKKTSLVAVARELAIRPRHLQTKLLDEDISYQALLDTTRKNIALNYLKRGNMTMCEIALLLGFSEQSSFNHAFKRWTTMTPAEYINQLPWE